jgi:hypothetical protein
MASYEDSFTLTFTAVKRTIEVYGDAYKPWPQASNGHRDTIVVQCFDKFEFPVPV